MQFNDTAATKSGMMQLCESLTNLGVGVGAGTEGGITGDATLKAIFTNYLNVSYREVWAAIMSVDKHWKADDFNRTDYPESPLDMVDSQRDYQLPVAASGDNIATLLRVNRVWVLDSDGTTRHELTKMSDDKNFDTTNTGIPTQYRLHGQSIYLDPRPKTGSLTLTDGLIILYQRTPDAFTTSDTTQQPGFMETYHDLLPLKASAIYLLPSKPELSVLYEQRFYARLELLKRDYVLKDDNTNNRFIPYAENNH